MSTTYHLCFLKSTIILDLGYIIIGMKLQNIQEAQAFLAQFIPQGAKQVFSENEGLLRQQKLLEFLDNPQETVKVIHVAGTSGKGSTVQIISSLLIELGFTVGLTVSPHILDVRERFQINNTLICEHEFCEYLTEIMPAIERMKETTFKKPTFFEITTALAFYIFSKKNVNYAVVETGLGGLFDGTNVVKRSDKVAVLTKIGLDHTAILGNSLTKIAFQKAGIIQKGNKVFSIEQSPYVEKVFKRVAQEKQAHLQFIRKGKEIETITSSGKYIVFDFEFRSARLQKVELGLLGSYQVENASLALAVVKYLSDRDAFLFNEKHIRHVLQTISVPGRFEIFSFVNSQIIIDGAHNPQKLLAFLTSLEQLYPDQKFDFLITFKQSKNYKKMLEILVNYANKIIITSFATKKQGMIMSSVNPEDIAKILETLGFKHYSIQENPLEVIHNYCNEGKNLVITGSLYLVSEVYPYLRSNFDKKSH